MELYGGWGEGGGVGGLAAKDEAVSGSFPQQVAVVVGSTTYCMSRHTGIQTSLSGQERHLILLATVPQSICKRRPSLRTATAPEEVSTRPRPQGTYS